MAYKKPFPPKHPEAKLDYLFDWASKTNNNGLTDWLEDGEIILTAEVSSENDLNIISNEIINEGTSVLFWADGGTNETEYDITCQIVTSLGREDTRVVKLLVKE